MKKLKIFAGFFSLIMLALCLCVPTTSALASEPAPESEWDYECDFSDIEEVNSDFNAYYLTAFMGTVTPEKVKETNEGDNHFILENGVIRRENNVGLEYNADSIAMLYFNKHKYANFRMQVDLRQGDMTTFWTGFCIRTPSYAKHFFEEGESFYVEWNGNIKTWGNGFHGGPFQCGVIPLYNQTLWYTYDVTVDGNLMTIGVRPSGSAESEASVFTVRIPWKFYQEGYVSLVSINNNSMFRNFKIKGLPNTEEVGVDVSDEQRVPSADGENSLDEMISNSNQTGGVQDVPPTPNTKEKEGGCSSSLGGGAVIGMGMLVAGIKLFKRKKQRG